MGKATNFARSINWLYSPDFKTIQISTKRQPAMSGGKKSEPVTNLTGVESSPLVLQDTRTNQGIRAALGLEGTAVQIWEMYLKKCAHVDSGASVNQLPDIIAGDRVTISNIDYSVRWADTTHPFSFGDVLILYVTEDKRA
jgi:hypothetical protein